MKILFSTCCNRAAFISLLMFFAFTKGYSQSEEEIKRLNELQQRTRKIYDSAFNSAELKRIRSEYLDIISKSKSFIAFTIGYEINKADVNGLNADLQSNGFPSMKDRFGAIVFGYSRMNKRVAGNLLFNVVPGNNVTNAGYEISLRGAGASFDKGYAFVYTDNIIVHGFAGIGWQEHTIKQTKKNNNSPVLPLFDLLPDHYTGKISREIFHGSIGLQFDLNAAYRKISNFGFQTGIRFSYNPVLIKGKYKYGKDESTYNPEIDWRQYNISILLKLFSRTYFRR